jgi:hypothetical protein
MSAAVPPPSESFWVRFWHRPVRAERLACMRILLALALLTDQLVQYLPFLDEFYGPEGVNLPDLYAGEQLGRWYWTHAFFSTNNLAFVYAAFGLWVGCTVLFLVGWRTRWTNLAVWFLSRCFIEMIPGMRTGADDTLQLALFLLLLTPCGLALSLDARRLRRRGLLAGPAWVKPWSLRVIQLQVCLIYCTTGLIKLKGDSWMSGPLEFERTWPWCSWLHGTWWDGTSVHNVFNLTDMSRWAYAQLPVPPWVTKCLTYASVWWELFFPLLMLHRWTRRPALAFGVLFHLGIFFTVEIGWFSFYTLSFYGVWVPCRFWARFDAPPGGGPTADPGREALSPGRAGGGAPAAPPPLTPSASLTDKTGVP